MQFRWRKRPRRGRFALSIARGVARWCLSCATGNLRACAPTRPRPRAIAACPCAPGRTAPIALCGRCAASGRAGRRNSSASPGTKRLTPQPASWRACAASLATTPSTWRTARVNRAPRPTRSSACSTASAAFSTATTITRTRRSTPWCALCTAKARFTPAAATLMRRPMRICCLFSALHLLKREPVAPHGMAPGTAYANS